MSTFTSLLRISLLNYFSITAMKVRYIEEKKRLWEPLLIGFAVLAAGGSFGSAFYFLTRGLAMGPQPDIALTVPILFTQVLALFLGLFALLSVFYFSNDLDILVPLPIKEKHILAVKFATVNSSEYIPALFVFVPALIAYSRYAGLSVAGWAVTVVVFLLLPIIPLSLMGIVAVTMMRGLNRRHRDLLMVLASILLVGAVLYFQYVMQSALVNNIDIEEFINNRVDLVQLLGSFFPPSIWATRAIAQAGTVPGLTNLALFSVASFVSLFAFLEIGQRSFYGGLVGGAEKDRKGVVFTPQVLQRKANQSPVLSALFAREWRLFVRVPIWVMNGFMSIILVPLLLFFPAMTAGKSMPELASMVHFAPHGLLLGSFVAAALIGFLSSINTLASTSISREGKHLWISRSLPVRPVEQIISKLTHAAIGTVIAAIPVAATFAVVITPGIEYVIMATVLGLVFSAAPQILGLLFDLWRPLLGWTNPQHAVKNNLNAIFPMIIIAASGFATYLFVNSIIIPQNLGDASAWLLVTGLHTLLTLLSLTVLFRLGPRLYEELDDK